MMRLVLFLVESFESNPIQWSRGLGLRSIDRLGSCLLFMDLCLVLSMAIQVNQGKKASTAPTHGIGRRRSVNASQA
jgi:hypothetical protein